MSMKCGAGTDNVYSPKLWYFDLFGLLGDHDVPSTSSSNFHDEDGSEMAEEGIKDTVQHTFPIRNEEWSEQTTMPPNYGTRPQKNQKREALLRPNIAEKRKYKELTTE
ncbi:hypothetical protein FQA39_LY13143 [Lamprigera yunnana]|nr:hypothetical protein FQA39_LY13143 [Lamprigera yunnana]